MSMVVTSRASLMEKHERTKQYPGYKELAEKQAVVLRALPVECSDICLDEFDYSLFQVYTPEQELQSLIEIYGLAALEQAFAKVKSETVLFAEYEAM